MLINKLKYFIPPILGIVYQRLVDYKSLSVPVDYKGLYKGYEELPDVKEDAWTSINWLSGAKKTTFYKSPENSHQFAIQMLADELLLQNNGFFIFDFGGGTSNLFKMIINNNKTIDTTNMQYLVFDNESTCEILGERMPEVLCCSSFDKINGMLKYKNGIVAANSSLHYCVKWKEIISLFIEMNPTYIVIGRHPIPLDQDEPIYTVQTILNCGQSHVVLIPLGQLQEEMIKYNYILQSNLPLNDASHYFNKKERLKVGRIENRTLIFKKRD